MNLLFQTDGQCQIILSRDWEVISFNTKIQNTYTLGKHSNLKKGLSLKNQIQESLLPFFKESFELALKGEEIFGKKIITLNGKEYWFKISFYPLWAEENQINQILFISEDVTETFYKEKKIIEKEKERLQREEYLKQSESKWRSLVESSPNVIYTLDKNFNYTYINYTILDLKFQEVIGTSYLDFIKLEDQNRIKKYLTDCLHKGLVREFEIQGEVKEELTAWYLNRIAPIRDNLTNEIVAIIGTASEITEKKVFENKLIESEERFRTMADNAPVMIWISGIDAECNFFNKPWLEFTGKTMEQEIGLGWAEGIHPDDYNFCLTTYKSSFQKRESFEMEYRLKRKDGKYRWLLDRGIPLITSKGDFSGYIGSCIDITTRKEIESEVKRSLEEKEILLKEIHHRVKNNLQIISSLLSLQSNQLEDSKTLDIFQTNIGRVKSIALIHDMLNISANHSEINFKDYLKQICNYLLSIHETKTKLISLELISDDIIIEIDIAIYVGLIVNELVSNSLKYAFPNNRNGKVKIEIIRQSEKMISLKVIDDGIGIPEDMDLDEVKSLGLKLVNTLTKQLNGNLTIQKGNGSIFIIILPTHIEKHRGR